VKDELAPLLAAAPARRRPSLLRRWAKGVNWRGAVCVAGFLLLWELLVRLGVSGFEGIPTLAEVWRSFWDKYVASGKYWQSWIVSFERVEDAPVFLAWQPQPA